MAEGKLNIGCRITDLFVGLVPDADWSFAHLSQKETTYITHGYHRYPAKFIPQLARRLIETYSRKGQVVLDPFMGSGTTLVEARWLGRPSIGVDINPVAHLIAQAKIQALEPHSLRYATQSLTQRVYFRHEPTLFSDENAFLDASKWSEKLLYWFREDVLRSLYGIYQAITDMESPYQVFFKCALSHILKTV